jgi:DNA end-binding protein Ku
MEGGLAAQTLHEQRDLNSAADVFGDAASIKTDPQMVQLAVQLIDRQTGRYDPADLEDRYEARLRAMLDAKLKGEGLEVEPAEPDRGNVVDLMAALRKSLQEEKAPEAPAPKSAPKAKAARNSTGPAEVKAPAEPKPAKKRAAAQAATRPTRKSA